MATSTVGQRMPAVEGKNLEGTALSLPQAVAGGPAVVIMGFSPLAAADDERWARWAAERFMAEIPVYLVVVVEGPRFLSPVIEGMLRSQANPRLYPFAVIRFDPRKTLRAGFDVAHDHHAVVLALDANGVIRHRADAGFSMGAAEALALVMAPLRGR